jgi:YHS domain-containing protein
MSSVGAVTRGRAVPARSGRPPRDTIACTSHSTLAASAAAARQQFDVESQARILSVTHLFVARTQVESQGSDGSAPDAVPAAPVTSLEAAGDKFVNPVCGVAVSMVNPMHVETYEGVAYYFCYKGCWVKFRQDPAKYAAIHHAGRDGAPRQSGLENT